MTKTLHYLSTEIEIRQGLLNFPLASLAPLGKRFALITDDTTAKLYGNQLAKILNAEIFSFPHGEQSKTRQTKESLENQMFEKELGRDTCVIAMGGGVATDLGGFIAATYCRGVPLVMIPTSLLGMCDASMGGKTGVNVPYGKNLLGCIYQPKKILIDPDTLETLPIKELRNGVVEMIKHGLIADRAYFEFLGNNADRLLKLDPLILEKAIYDSCRIKTAIIQQDEKEQGVRYLLNAGHTVGHALENLTGYSLAHGEAVAIGLLVESRMALELGALKKESFDAIQTILIQYGLPLKLPKPFPVPALMHAMILDKKSLSGRPRFALIKEIGEPLPLSFVDEPLIKNALEWMNHDLCCH